MSCAPVINSFSQQPSTNQPTRMHTINPYPPPQISPYAWSPALLAAKIPTLVCGLAHVCLRVCVLHPRVHPACTWLV